MLDNEWKERDVGFLHLKPCAGDKTQLLIRSDTTLGQYTARFLVHLLYVTKSWFIISTKMI